MTNKKSAESKTRETLPRWMTTRATARQVESWCAAPRVHVLDLCVDTHPFAVLQ